MKLLLRKAVILPDGTNEFNETGIVGQIRIWITDTNTPTDYFILVQDDGLPLSIDNRLDSIDFTDEFNPRIQDVFTKAKSRLVDYGKDLRRSFHMDIKIPLSLVQKYQQRLG